MNFPDLISFWNDNQAHITQALPQGTKALAHVLQTGAQKLGLSQHVDGHYILWNHPEDGLSLMFCIIADPRDLDRILDVYIQTQERQCPFTMILLHQWTDGEGNWNIFLITKQRAMQYVGRLDGNNTIEERGPQLRTDTYTLFACDREFPEPGQTQWAQLLDGPVDDLVKELGALAQKHACTQTYKDYLVQWSNPEVHLEVQFFLLPDPGDITPFICMYQHLKQTPCPVSFVFVKCDQPRCYDIFRLSARSFLEHHNQVKGRLRVEPASPGEHIQGKQLNALQWVPHWASHVGCIQGCLRYLGVEVSNAWLFGATGHAFVLNIAPGLCPSAPTDWDTSTFLKLGRNIGYLVETVDNYCPDKNNDLLIAQQRAWDFVRNALDEAHPCYGWELHIPEYAVIYGYDQTGYYISGPGCDQGRGPIDWQNLGTSEIGVVLVLSVKATALADDHRTVRDALRYALDLGHNRRRWTNHAGGLKAYDAWINTLKKGAAGRFGLGYNAAVWADSRKYVPAFLQEAKQRLDKNLYTYFDQAVIHYEVVAQNLRTVSDAYPFDDSRDKNVKYDEQAETAVESLRQAQHAEAAGLEVLAELVKKIPS
jgi:hypothetical protein